MRNYHTPKPITKRDEVKHYSVNDKKHDLDLENSATFDLANISDTGTTAYCEDEHKRLIFKFKTENNYFIPTFETIPIGQAIEFVFHPERLTEMKWRDKIIAATVRAKNEGYTYMWCSQHHTQKVIPQMKSISVETVEDCNSNKSTEEKKPFEVVTNQSELVLHFGYCNNYTNCDISSSSPSTMVSVHKPIAPIETSTLTHNTFSENTSYNDNSISTTDVCYNNKNGEINDDTSYDNSTNLSPIIANISNIVSEDVNEKMNGKETISDSTCKTQVSDLINKKVIGPNLNNQHDVAKVSSDSISNKNNCISSNDSKTSCENRNDNECTALTDNLYSNCVKLSTNSLEEIEVTSLEESAMKESLEEEPTPKASAMEKLILSTEESIEIVTFEKEPRKNIFKDTVKDVFIRKTPPELCNEPVIEAYKPISKESAAADVVTIATAKPVIETYVPILKELTIGEDAVNSLEAGPVIETYMPTLKESAVAEEAATIHTAKPVTETYTPTLTEATIAEDAHTISKAKPVIETYVPILKQTTFVKESVTIPTKKHIIETYIPIQKESTIAKESINIPTKEPVIEANTDSSTLTDNATEFDCIKKAVKFISIEIKSARVPNKSNKSFSPTMEADKESKVTADDSADVFKKVPKNIKKELERKCQTAKELSILRANMMEYYNALEQKATEQVKSEGFLDSTSEFLHALNLIDLGFLRSGGLTVFHDSALCTEIDRIVSASWKSSKNKDKRKYIE
ncbi:uncharacterized threonine-rich GPI-anchored glycoprotein PJ4664.02-like isoform X2 [Teleopsis dalmanni]|uniref:uncharacterized threonine-rich GPI-anchored glycoprotein PJ4664.02-like isoform X2 n=1 Tax=Teleopsis dalmanni TaxID=139649 RepID=UPI0018CE0FF1|nr:uncharacterized threonine-rich GPI-anchored glycoprotein PJ4664.02-like isoform X2 [Teleopsis dalmanni]